jgi:hypothetical protein
MTVKEEAEHIAYGDKSRDYFESLYDGVRENLSTHNSCRPCNEKLSLAEENEFGFDSRRFSIQHDETPSATSVIRNTDNSPHVITIVCRVCSDDSHELQLETDNKGDIHAYRDGRPLSLFQVVELIVNPLRNLKARRL